MEDNTPVESNSNEMIANPEKIGISLRSNLEANFDANQEADRVVPDKVEIEGETEEPAASEPAATPTPKVAVAPPADMNKAEREAFLNPTAENANVLQGYLSRRAYEYRTDYQKQTDELNQTRQKVDGFYNVMKDYESDYVKRGLNITDVARRSIEWDRAMQMNPVETALEWLDAYGVNLHDLSNYYQNGYSTQQPVEYLIKEQAEQIAQQKIEAMINEQRQSTIAYNNHNAVQSFIGNKPLFKDPGTAAQLEEAMAPIVAALSNQGGSPQEILETAYNYVTKGHPTFSALSQKLEAASLAEKKAAEAQKAKAATKSITGSAGSGTPRTKIKDLGENLRRRYKGE